MVKKYKYLIISVSLFLLSLILIIFNYLDINKSYTYEITKDSNYKVNLKPNSFYDTSVLDENKVYLASLIANYELEFDYKYRGNKSKELNYYYEITMELVSTYNDDEIWNKKYLVKKEPINSINSKTLEIKDKVIIDYDIYNKLVSNYEKVYNIDIDSILKVRLDVYIDKIKDKDNYIELDIGIDKLVSRVSNNYEDSNSNIVPSSKYEALIISLMLLSLSLVFLILHFKRKSKYNKKVRYILNNYGNLIVRIVNKPNLSNLRKISLKSINDLINLANQNNVNILYYEEKNRSSFYIILDTYLYSLEFDN